MIWWRHDTISKDVKCNTCISHLLLNRIMPKGSTCGFVDGICILNGFEKFNPKFMCMLVVMSTLALNQGDDLVSLFEDPTHPPGESWFISNLCRKCAQPPREGATLSGQTTSVKKYYRPSIHIIAPIHGWACNFLENLFFGKKMYQSKAKWTFYFSEVRKNTLSDQLSTPE